MSVLWGLWLVFQAAEVCRPPAPMPVADPLVAEAYATVADEQRARGNLEAALVGYREALKHSATHDRARRGFFELCQQDAPNDFDLGLQFMDSGQLEAAIAAFQRVQNSDQLPAATLLLGICWYRLGNDRASKEALELAARTEALNPSARFFLGLLALRQGLGADAASEFQASARSNDPRLREWALELSHLAQREGRLALSALLAPGYDSNVALLPHTGAWGDAGDASLSLSVAGAVRPWGQNGPYAQLSGAYRKQLRHSAFDLATSGASLGWWLGGNTRYAVLEYGYDYFWLGPSPYLGTHHLLTGGRWSFARFEAGASYTLQLQSYRNGSDRIYSGRRSFAQLDVGWRFDWGALRGGWRLGWDRTEEVLQRYSESGPFVNARWNGTKTRLSAELGLLSRTYSTELDPSRTDTFFDASLSPEVDLDNHFSLRLSLSARRALSNAQDAGYSRFTASFGLLYAAGWL